jgi:hypothetical protein
MKSLMRYSSLAQEPCYVVRLVQNLLPDVTMGLTAVQVYDKRKPMRLLTMSAIRRRSACPLRFVPI